MHDDMVAELQRLGMSGYEAKAYLALVAEGRPLNGYEVAKHSGVPRSTVYETLAKLVTRGAVFEVRGDDDTTTYMPLPPRSLLARLRRGFAESVDRLERAFDRLGTTAATRLLHQVDSPDHVRARAEDILHAATSELYLSAWPEELTALEDGLRSAERRGVRITSIVFGEDTPQFGDSFLHRFSAPETVLERVGCRLLVVAGDRSEVLVAGALEDRMWGVYSDDPAVVLVAVEFVRHDIAMQVLVERIGADEVESFWHDDPVLERLATGRGAPGLDTTMPGPGRPREAQG